MKNKDNKFYITTPIYYASGKPHLGHAYTSVACDILARWNRNIGREVFFLTGTDEHGQKIERKAKEAGKSPKKFVDSLVPQFKKMLDVLNVSNDFFVRTTDKYHKEFVKEVLQKTYDNEDIYKDEYEGLYCVDCEQYYKEEELEDESICPIHKRKVEKFKEENYFFRLSKYQNKLLKFYKENPDFLSPKSKAEETVNRVKEGLLDISISRNKKTLSWGIELPFDSEHVVYVWFDALYNYISALVETDKEDFWPADVQMVGKDIMWFHKVFWPAFLMSAGYELPKKVFAHGWWTVNNEKMGKVLNNVIEPIEMAQKYGTDELRYYLFSLGTFGEDQNFTMESFAEKINNDLNNDLGNLISRVVSMTNKFFSSGVPKVGELTEVELNLLDKLNMHKEFNGYMQNLEYFKSLSLLWDGIRETNAYINRVEPWREKDESRLATIMNTLCSACILFAKYLECFMPQKSALIFKQFNMKNDEIFKLEFIEENHRLGQKINLFEKIKLENKRENPEEKKEGFELLNLKVGKIIEIKEHPEAEKLFIEKIDIGEDESRQIVSGLRDYYKKEELLGNNVVVVANLKHAKLRGVKSEGMILAAEDSKGNVGIVTTNSDVGENLMWKGKTADSDLKIKIEDFFSVEMKSLGCRIELDSEEVTVNGKSLVADKGIKGSIR